MFAFRPRKYMRDEEREGRVVFAFHRKAACKLTVSVLECLWIDKKVSAFLSTHWSFTIVLDCRITENNEHNID